MPPLQTGATSAVSSAHFPTLGILAGMGPSSTGPFLDLVYKQCRDQYGARHDGDYPKIVICSQPVPFFHDQAIDHDAICAATIEGLQTLERAGATLIAIACNSVHMYAEKLAASVNVPLLDIVECALDQIPDGVQRVAFCTSRPLTESGLYPRRAEARGLVAVQPVEPSWQGQIDQLQNYVHDGRGAAACAPVWSELFKKIGDAEHPAEAVVVACLDISGVVSSAQSDLPLVDAAETLAERLISRWLELREVSEA